MKAKLTTLPISLEVAKMFHTMCGNDKKLSFSTKSTTFHHCSTGQIKAVWPSCQTFYAQNQKPVTFVKVFKNLFSSKSFSGRIKVIFDRLTETTFAKIILGYRSKSGNDKKNLDFPKTTCLLNLFFWTEGCQFWKNCPKHFGKSLTRVFAQSLRIKTKNCFSKKKCRRKCASGYVDCGYQLHQNSFTQIEKKIIVRKYFFFQNVPFDAEEEGVTTLTSVFCSKSKHGENLKTVSFSLFFPQHVPLEMMNANLTTLPISFEVAKEFHIMCGNDKKFWFSPRGSTFQHCCTGHVKAVWASCQAFLAQNQKQVTFVKVFKKLFSSKSFSGRVKAIFDRLVETNFSKRYTTLLLKVGNW